MLVFFASTLPGKYLMHNFSTNNIICTRSIFFQQKRNVLVKMFQQHNFKISFNLQQIISKSLKKSQQILELNHVQHQDNYKA